MALSPYFRSSRRETTAWQPRAVNVTTQLPVTAMNHRIFATPRLWSGVRNPVASHRRSMEFLLSRSPNRFRPSDALSVAEAVFKPALPPTAEPVVAEKRTSIPISKEQVSLKLDSDLIAYFQEDGAGWQERINDALRKVAGL
jgi:uncharacterized protein (DUF4415 family)